MNYSSILWTIFVVVLNITFPSNGQRVAPGVPPQHYVSNLNSWKYQLKVELTEKKFLQWISSWFFFRLRVIFFVYKRPSRAYVYHFTSLFSATTAAISTTWTATLSAAGPTSATTTTIPECSTATLPTASARAACWSIRKYYSTGEIW